MVKLPARYIIVHKRVTIEKRMISQRRCGVLIDFNFMQYSVTVVTYCVPSSKFKSPYLRRMQKVKGFASKFNFSRVVDFYILQFKDLFALSLKFTDVQVLCLEIQTSANS